MARLKPRFNADVNRWWICDAGRYGFGFVDAAERLQMPMRQQGGTSTDATWDEAIAAMTAPLRRLPADEIGIIASPTMSNEDLFALRRLVDRLGIRHVAAQGPPRVPGDAPGHAVEPARQRRSAADGGSVAGQHEEGGLEGILRVLMVVQHAPADAHDQGAVAAHQRGEGGLVAGGAEAVQQVGVGRRGGIAGRRQLADLLHHGGQ